LFLNDFERSFALETKKMELYFLAPLISAFINNLPAASPVYLDLLKLVAGSLLWFGGLIGFMYWRQYKLKTAINK